MKPLVDALEQLGWSVWWDRTILAGKRWEDVIEAALNEARCVIVLWSRDSIQSDWVRVEADEARRRGVLVPALLDHVKIPLGFRSIQAANLVDWRGVVPSPEFDELVRAVSEVLGTDVGPGAVHVATAEARRNVTAEPAVPGTTGSHGLPGHLLWPRRNTALAVAAIIASVGGLAWYAASHRVSHKPKEEERSAPTEPVSVSPHSAASVALGQIRKNPKDGLEYVWIPPGTFMMGCSPENRECDEANEKPRHKVTISRGFWLGKTEVTVAAYGQFRKAAGKEEKNGENPDLPVVNVIWTEARAYCEWAGLRLPTEAELGVRGWREYARPAIW